MLVVVGDVVGDQAFELTAVPDDGSVAEFSPDGPDPALGEGVRYRGADRSLENLEACGAEDLVEGVYEVAAAIADECSGAGELVRMAVEEVGSASDGTFRYRVVAKPKSEHKAARLAKFVVPDIKVPQPSVM